jgi:hypothetical protein
MSFKAVLVISLVYLPIVAVALYLVYRGVSVLVKALDRRLRNILPGTLGPLRISTAAALLLTVLPVLVAWGVWRPSLKAVLVISLVYLSVALVTLYLVYRCVKVLVRALDRALRTILPSHVGPVRISTAAALLLTGVLASVAWRAWRPNPRHPNAENIKTQLSKELHVGTSRDVIRKYLSERHLEVYEIPGLPDKLYGSNTCSGTFPMSWLVQREFTFDSRDQLQHIQVHAVGEL